MITWAVAIVPSLFCGILLWYIARRFQKQDKREEAREAARTCNNVLLLKGVSAALSLGEATAEAIQTQHWNGEMNDARAYAKQTKRDIESFMLQQGSEHIVC